MIIKVKKQGWVPTCRYHMIANIGVKSIGKADIYIFGNLLKFSSWQN